MKLGDSLLHRLFHLFWRLALPLRQTTLGVLFVLSNNCLSSQEDGHGFKRLAISIIPFAIRPVPLVYDFLLPLRPSPVLLIEKSFHLRYYLHKYKNNQACPFPSLFQCFVSRYVAKACALSVLRTRAPYKFFMWTYCGANLRFKSFTAFQRPFLFGPFGFSLNFSIIWYRCFRLSNLACLGISLLSLRTSCDGAPLDLSWFLFSIWFHVFLNKVVFSFR